jgi:hypothetical protein
MNIHVALWAVQNTSVNWNTVCCIAIANAPQPSERWKSTQLYIVCNIFILGLRSLVRFPDNSNEPADQILKGSDQIRVVGRLSLYRRRKE